MLERREAEIRAKVCFAASAFSPAFAICFSYPALFSAVNRLLQSEWHERRMREREERAQHEQQRMLLQQQGV
jgi:hypothetical protein